MDERKDDWKNLVKDGLDTDRVSKGCKQLFFTSHCHGGKVVLTCVKVSSRFCC